MVKRAEAFFVPMLVRRPHGNGQGTWPLPFPTNPRRRVLRSEPFLEAPGSLFNPEDQRMDENRVEGTMKNVSGKVEEGVGRITGNARTRAEGVAKQAAKQRLRSRNGSETP
jgi:hypothetical protein